MLFLLGIFLIFLIVKNFILSRLGTISNVHSYGSCFVSAQVLMYVSFAGKPSTGGGEHRKP